MRFDLSRYSKSIADLLIGFHAWLAWVVITKPGPITSVEWVALGAVFVKAALVWLVPNTPAPAKAKPPAEAGSAGVFAMFCVLLIATVGFAGAHQSRGATPAAAGSCLAHPTRPKCTTTTSAATTTSSTTTTTVAGGYLFDDEFNGAQLDTSKWQPNWYGSSNTAITEPVNGAERAAYDPARVSVSGGNLQLNLAAKAATVGGTTYSETTGAVTTLHSFSFTYGHLTARVWLPGSTTALYDWPAVWTDGQPTWPHNGESDILEGLSGKGCWHYHSDAGAPGGCIAMAGGWHIVEEEVANGQVSYIYDGKLVGQLAAVRAPHFIIIGNQDGTYGGQHVVPTTMLVDYIRITKPVTAP